MTLQQIKEYKFNDPQLDNLVAFNYFLREALINRQITKQDYLEGENFLLLFNEKFSKLDGHVQDLVKEVIENY